MNALHAFLVVLPMSCTGATQQSIGASPHVVSLHAVLTINSPDAAASEHMSVGAVAVTNGEATQDWYVGWMAPSSSEHSGCAARYSGDDGTIRWLATPEVSAPSYGYSMCVLSDFDGDGQLDLAIGAPDVLVFGSKECSTFVDIRSGASGALIARLPGRAPDDRFGASLSALGDVDGDGIADFLIGVPKRRSVPKKGGSIEMRSGRTFELLYEVQLDQSNNIGFGVAACGDVDADEIPDFCDSSGTNGVFVWSGRDGRLLLHRTPKTGFVSAYQPSAVIDLDCDGHLDYFGMHERSSLFSGPRTSSTSLDFTTERWTARGSQSFLAVVDLKDCAKECDKLMAVIPSWDRVELRDKRSPMEVLSALDMRTVKDRVFWRWLSQCARSSAEATRFAVWGVEQLPHAETLTPPERGVVAILEVRVSDR